MIALLLLGCASRGALTASNPDDSSNPDACDPRDLSPGEVRARQVPCGDELVDGGEGRVGDWLIENAYARYVVRGTYAALTHLGEEGGTLIDAAAPGGEDLLMEYLPDGDRTEILAVNEDGEARLELPGVTYRLGADDGALYFDGSSTGSLQGRVEVERTGSTLRGDDAFFGVDGRGFGSGSVVWLEDVTHAAVGPEFLWPDGAQATLEIDADDVLVLRDGGELARFPVTDGVLDAWLPPDVTVVGEREGCLYEGFAQLGCGWLQLRVADDQGTDLVATLTDGRGVNLHVPKGGGRIPVGPFPLRLWLWAGPAWSVAELVLPGGDVTRGVTLTRDFTADDAVLAAMSVEVAPDAGSAIAPELALTELSGEGVGFAVLVADDEVPTVSVDDHDAIVAVAGSRASGAVTSWPWSPNGKRAGHGAVPWQDLSALDMLAASEGGQSNARLTVVDTFWVERARGEADASTWDPRPDALWMLDLGALETYMALLDDWIDVAPVGPRTWIEVDEDRNLVAYEAGIVDGRTTAGNGPRLDLTLRDRTDAGWEIGVRLQAARWMRMYSVALWTSSGEMVRGVEGSGEWKWTVPADADWVIAVARGERARPWAGDEPAWAVSAPLWLRGRP